ncbi:MAG TPA: hypothetical protein VF011_08295 [Terriglobales bacterium]
MTNAQSEIDTVVAFVKHRIEEEAKRSGEPLSSEERFLLDHLPSESVLPRPFAAGPENLTVLVPRDRAYERICKLAKNAYHDDLRLNPSAREWQHAAAVTQINRDPIFWLLEWAGVKERSRSLDQWLLWGSGLIVVVVMLPLVLLVALSERATALRWAMLVIAFLALISLLQLASRRIVKRQLTRTINSR